MKKLKRMLCVAMAAVVLACVPVTAFAQEISSAENGRMYLVFESCANKYSDAVRVVDEVWSFEL